ncbi:hypothetical protein ACE6H2_006943 [Prunus campanulata]
MTMHAYPIHSSMCFAKGKIPAAYLDFTVHTKEGFPTDVGTSEVNNHFHTLKSFSCSILFELIVSFTCVMLLAHLLCFLNFC